MAFREQSSSDLRQVKTGQGQTGIASNGVENWRKRPRKGQWGRRPCSKSTGLDVLAKPPHSTNQKPCRPPPPRTA
ncbi:hypothetical protein K449DRAFT_439113 [Hypoxylon sp. EC38]|nr:hypothetical protein K449DRAFT_439113 [Hypoxylon sp. EC38]